MAISARSMTSSGLRFGAAAALLAGSLGLAVIGTSGTPSAAAAVVPICTPQNIVVNTPGNTRRLYEYTPDGVQVGNVPLTKDYGDIAFSGDGSTLYGIVFASPPPVLWVIDPATGTASNPVTVTGPLAALGGINGLTSLPDGTLLAGTYSTNVLYTINPTTGVSAGFRANLPPGYGSGGDFVTLPDGDVLAAALTPTGGGETVLIRIHPNNSSTIIGKAPAYTFGESQSGGMVYLAGNDGIIRRLDSIPIAAGSATLPTTTLATIGTPLWGTSSIQDSGNCNAPTARPDSATTPQDTAVTVPVLSNDDPVVAGVPLVPASLRLVADDGTLVMTVSISGQGTFSVDPSGTITFTPDPGFVGVAPTRTYEVEDEDGRVARSTVTVTVTAAAPTTTPASTSSAPFSSASTTTASTTTASTTTASTSSPPSTTTVTASSTTAHESPAASSARSLAGTGGVPTGVPAGSAVAQKAGRDVRLATGLALAGLVLLAAAVRLANRGRRE